MPELRHVFVVNPIEIASGGMAENVSVVNVGSCGDPHPDVLTVQGCEGMQPVSVIGDFATISNLEISNLEISNLEISNISVANVGSCGDPHPDVLTVQGCEGMQPISISGDVQTVQSTAFIDTPGTQEWEGTFVAGNSILLWDTDLTGSGTATDVLAESARSLTNTTASGDKVIVQARQRHLYLLGRTKRIVMGALMGAKKTGVRKRIGIFDEDDGIFFEQDASDLKVVTRTSASGSPVDTPIAQSSWNIDKLDGTGPSGIALDETKINFWIIEFDWHGTGKVRWGFRIGGSIIYVHQVDFANTQTTPYTVTPTLPSRAEIENLAATASSTTLKLYSSSVTNLSGDSPLFIERSFDNGTPGTVVTTSLTPLISVRLGSGYEKNLLRIASINVFTGSGNTIRWEAIANGTLTGASFTAPIGSISEFDIAATAVTGGFTIQSGFFDNNNGVLATGTIGSLLYLSRDILGNVDIVTLAGQRATGTATVNASILVQEFKR